MAENSSAGKKDMLQALCGVTTCGSCEYQYVNGIWTRVGLGNCSGTCSCPQYKSMLEIALAQVVCAPAPPHHPTILTIIVNCTPASATKLSDEQLLSHLNTLLDGIDLPESHILIVLKKLVQGRNFWQRLSIGLGVVSLLLLAGLVYALLR